MMTYLNGRLMVAEAARIDPTDRGFTLGDGLFETIRAEGGNPLRLAAHLARLRAGAVVLEMPLPTDEILIQALMATLKANGLSEAALRLTVTRGPAPRGLLPPLVSQPTVVVTAGPLPLSLPPARVIVATVTRRNEYSPLARIKCLNVLDNVLARQEAARRGADDAILCNTAGRVVETTIANLFLVLDGRLVTPPVSEGALPGVARAEMIAETGAVERLVTLQDLLAAEKMFVTNALGVRDVILVEERTRV